MLSLVLTHFTARYLAPDSESKREEGGVNQAFCCFFG